MIKSTYHQFLLLHYPNLSKLRLGQRFCNMYIKNSWPELFYADDETASLLIQQWLVDNHYTTQLPQELKRD